MLKHLENNFDLFDNSINVQLSKFYSEYFNSFISLSLLEAFEDTKIKYLKFFSNNKILN